MPPNPRLSAISAGKRLSVSRYFVTIRRQNFSRAFTLVELLVGMSLALMVMTAVLSTYTTLGRSFTRSLGVSSANQPTLEGQARRTLARLAQDVRMAKDISGAPSNTTVTLSLPTGTGTTTVAYSYNSAAGTLTRTPSGGTAQVLQSNITSNGLAFRYYDSSGNPYDNGSAPYTTTLSTSSSLGIKQLALSFTSRAGSATNGTLTQIYQTDSPRLLLRNRSLLP
jgi:Tfp pilus assembly protein PilW